MMILTVDHGVTLTTIEKVKVKEMEVINQANFRFVFPASELKEVKACGPFVSQFRKDWLHFQYIDQLRR